MWAVDFDCLHHYKILVVVVERKRKTMEKRQAKQLTKKVIDVIFANRLVMCGQDKAGDYWYAVHTKKGGTSAMYRLPKEDNLIDVTREDDNRVRLNDKSVQGVVSDAQYGGDTHAWGATASRVTSAGEVVQLDYGDERAYLNVALFKEVFGDWRKFSYTGTDSVHPILVHDTADGDVLGVICPCRCREGEEEKTK